jgi:DNA-binding NtrC family response regulator
MTAETAHYSRRIELPESDLIFGRTVGMREVRGQLERAFQDDLPVLIEGESGTGKEVIGRFLHGHSARRAEAFIKLNCAAMPASLSEGELFRYVRMEGTVIRHDGGSSIQRASVGTVFLDEVGDLDLGVQARLARMLERRDRSPIDLGPEQRPASARLVCATSVDLEAQSARQGFVRDLLGCFSSHRIALLPLRERKEDIPQLCDYLLAKLAREFGRPVPRLSPYALHALQQWKWPGNIRELENWIARIVIFGTEEAIGLDFNRQLTAWGQELPRLHRAMHGKMVRARRLRRHS